MSPPYASCFSRERPETRSSSTVQPTRQVRSLGIVTSSFCRMFCCYSCSWWLICILSVFVLPLSFFFQILADRKSFRLHGCNIPHLAPLAAKSPRGHYLRALLSPSKPHTASHERVIAILETALSIETAYL
jgi:hypothetical protein